MHNPRLLAIAGALLAIGAAAAQTPTQIREGRVQTAFETLRSSPSLFVRLTGAQTVGDKTQALTAWGYWLSEAATTGDLLRAELRAGRDDVIHERIAADGVDLWNYDVRSRRYGGWTYGRHSGGTNPNYRRDFFNALSGAASGELGWIGRLMREVYAGDAAAYRTWLPGVEPQDASDDPRDVVLTLGDPVRRYVVFDLDQASEDDPLTLKAIRFYDKRAVGGMVRETVWTLQVLGLDQIPADQSFAPYDATQLAGWRPLYRPANFTP